MGRPLKEPGKKKYEKAVKIGRRKKYDFPLIKHEFFASDIDEVKTYFEENYGIYNGTIRTATTGWGKEKELWKQEQLEKSRIRLEKERQDKWDSVLRNVDNAQMAGLQMFSSKTIELQKITSKLTKMANEGAVDMKEVKELILVAKALNEIDKTSVNDMLKMFKLEKGEATENVSTTSNKSELMELYERAKNKGKL